MHSSHAIYLCRQHRSLALFPAGRADGFLVACLLMMNCISSTSTWHYYILGVLRVQLNHSRNGWLWLTSIFAGGDQHIADSRLWVIDLKAMKSSRPTFIHVTLVNSRLWLCRRWLIAVQISSWYYYYYYCYLLFWQYRYISRRSKMFAVHTVCAS